MITAGIQLSAAVSYSVSGKVVDAKSGEALVGAVVSLENLWAISDENGEFEFDKVQSGKYGMKVDLLGYAAYNEEVMVSGNLSGLEIRLSVSSLALEEVVVTASRPKDGAGTTYNIGRDALNHIQLSNMADMSSLMPGGKTVNPDLTASKPFSLRSGNSTAGNAAFSTAVEVDGVRVGGNAGFGTMSGADTRSISVDNVDYVEVVTGVPSAEYGDLGNGMVKIHTKRGKTPLTINMSVNPRTYQGSVSKGININEKGAVLNLNAEWARAVKDLVSPYESYTRRTIGAVYSNTFNKTVRFEAGVTGNIGGMNSEDDPDAFFGAYTKSNDNSVRANASVTWLLNRSWITNLKFEPYFDYEDNKSHEHIYNSAASMLPAIHAEVEGYSFADLLPQGEYFSDKIVDSKEINAGASLKYTWDKRWGDFKSNLKAGFQWKTNGNVGQGEYYMDPALAADKYRPRPYTDYPFMHTLSSYIEDEFTFPFGLQVIAGIRMDDIHIKGSEYSNVRSFSPRLNAKWNIADGLIIRGGWGVSEKMPSFYILYPQQEYRDILVDSSNEGGIPSYRYYTKPYTLEFNKDLKWQRHINSEVGMDVSVGNLDLSLVGFYNITENPYKYTYTYSVLKINRSTGLDKTFVQNKHQDNGAPVYRAGAELTVDFPEIKPIRTSVRVDASYTWTRTEDDGYNYYYNNGWSHTNLINRSYQYVGIYANGGNDNLLIKGSYSHNLDANLTTITHIPEAKLIITCRLETSLLKRSRDIPTGGTDALYPIGYLDVEDTNPVIHPFTESDRTNDKFKDLVRFPSNDYMFDLDGYGAYASANLSVTKEIGEKISLSFFANNFTNSRPYVKSLATGVGAIFTPAFYYGLSCRIKL